MSHIAVASRPMLRAALGIALLLFSNAVIPAADFAKSEDDLQIVVQHSWVGGTHGGYHPIRVRATNRGAPRRFTFLFDARDSHGIPTASRSIDLLQNATVEFTLLVPLVGEGQGGNFRVLSNGVPLKDLSQYISLCGWDLHSSRPGLLVLDENPRSLDPYEKAVTALPLGSGSTSWRPHYGGGRTENHFWTNPDLLPDTWVGYTAVDLVALPLGELKKLKAAHRQALLQWVQTGGRLMIYNVGARPDDSKPLTGLLESVVLKPTWTAANREIRRALPQVEVNSSGGVSVTTSATSEEVVTEKPTEEQKATEAADAWKASHGASFFTAEVLLGKIIAFPENPFPGTRDDWGWLLNSLGMKDCSWQSRMGFTSRAQTGDFRKFLIPGVTSIPVPTRLVLITLFAICIGPLNYFVLWKRKQLMLLVATIPVIALFTSLTLFSYSIVAYGFATKVRLRSLTVVDQSQNVAVDWSRNALFAGLAPSSGLRFQPESAVYPLWLENGAFKRGAVDWSDTQHFRQGWFPSRTQTQFVTVTHRAERGRLEVGEVQNGKLSVSNGFTVPFRMLAVKQPNGDVYFGRNLAAGGQAELSRLTTSDTDDWKKEFEQAKLVYPGGGTTSDDNGWNGLRFSSRSYHYYGYDPNAQAALGYGLMEETLQKLALGPVEPLSVSGAGPGFTGICEKNPGIDYGTTSNDERNSLHVITGRFR